MIHRSRAERQTVDGTSDHFVNADIPCHSQSSILLSIVVNRVLDATRRRALSVKIAGCVHENDSKAPQLDIIIVCKALPSLPYGTSFHQLIEQEEPESQYTQDLLLYKHYRSGPISDFSWCL